MATWGQFALAEPEMAASGRGLFFQYKVGLAYLATVRADGGPRMHPFCPIQFGEGLYGLINDSFKRRDLIRDGRFAMHAFPRDKSDDEFYLAGTAHRIEDPALIAAAHAHQKEVGASSSEHEWLFEFDIDHVLLSIYESLGAWPPKYMKWHA
jgi:hypothetical protein